MLAESTLKKTSTYDRNTSRKDVLDGHCLWDSWNLEDQNYLLAPSFDDWETRGAKRRQVVLNRIGEEDQRPWSPGSQKVQPKGKRQL